MTTTVTRQVLLDATATQLAVAASDTHLPGVVDAVAGLMDRWHGLTLAADDDTDVPSSAVWPADRFRGAVMLAAKLHRRRNSPDGLTANEEYGPVYVARSDPDISMLLGLGRWGQGFVL